MAAGIDKISSIFALTQLMSCNTAGVTLSGDSANMFLPIVEHMSTEKQLNSWRTFKDEEDP